MGTPTHLNAISAQSPTFQTSSPYSSGSISSYANAPALQAHTFSSGSNQLSPQPSGFSGVFHPASSAPQTKPNPAALSYAQQVEAMAKTVQDKINPADLSALLKWSHGRSSARSRKVY